MEKKCNNKYEYECVVERLHLKSSSFGLIRSKKKFFFNVDLGENTVRLFQIALFSDIRALDSSKLRSADANFLLCKNDLSLLRDMY